MRLKDLLTGFGLAFVLLAQPSLAEENTSQELYQLCSRFPYNGQCEGLEIPVPMDSRMGTLIHCSLAVNSPAESELCKVAIADDHITLYVETGEPIELLGDQRATQEIVIPFSHLLSFNLQFWDRETDVGSVLTRSHLYVLEDEDDTKLEGEFTPTPDADARRNFGNEGFAEAQIGFLTDTQDMTQNQTNVVAIVATEEFGAFLRDQITSALEQSEAAAWVPSSQTTDRAVASDSSALVAQLLETNRCIRCDLRGVDLSQANLANANLEGANLQGANLREANLTDSYLVGANLDGADLTDALLNQARLDRATLVAANLEEADLDAASLQRASLQDSNLTNAQLSGANLESANLENAILTGADLSDITTERDLIPLLGWHRYSFHTTLHNANLSGADLSDANLEEAQGGTADLSGTNLSGADLEDAVLREANLCGTTLPNGVVSNQGCYY